MNTSQILIAIAFFVGVLVYIDQRGRSALDNIAAAAAVLFFGLLIYEVIDTLRHRLHAETHRRLGQAELEHARADYQYALAEKARGKVAPIAQADNAIPADKLSLNDAASKLVELSILQYTDAGTQILPAHLCGDNLGMDWQDVKNYMQENRWVVPIQRGNEAGTYVTAGVKNLKMLQVLITLASLPPTYRQ